MHMLQMAGSPQAKKTCTIGIDLGTTYCCTASYKKNGPCTIENSSGNYTTPSWVLFKKEGNYTVGEAAKANPCENAVYDTKRMLGRQFTDPLLQEDKTRWPFTLVDVGGLPKIRVDARKGKPDLSPEEISSYLLRSFIDRAEKKLNATVTSAVVTVPAYFNNAQRKATMDAAKLAGLNVLRLFSEPLAAAIAHGLDNSDDEKKNILVFDLGGGTFDLSVVTINKGTFDVRAINGNTHLGGEDFTNRLYDFAIDKFKEKSVNIASNDLGYFREKCESAKRMLSNDDSYIDIHHYGHSIKVSRADFEYMNQDLFDSMLPPLQQVLDDAGLKKEAIDEVVMTGGSVRIPKVQELVQAFFEGKELNMSSAVDQAVAHGAAIVAAHLVGGESIALKDLCIHDVTPLSLGIETNDKVFCNVVKRNTPIPLTAPYTFTTVLDNQTSVLFSVYEGERPVAKDNSFLGQFVLENIPPSPRGVPNLDSVFKVDMDGILTVRATLRGTKNCSEIVIRREGRMESSQIRECILQAQEMHSLDESIRSKQVARIQLERFTNDVRTKVDRLNLSSEEKSYILAKCDSVRDWMDGQELFKNEHHEEKRREQLYRKEEYEYKQKELAMECSKRGINL